MLKIIYPARLSRLKRNSLIDQSLVSAMSINSTRSLHWGQLNIQFFSAQERDSEPFHVEILQKKNCATDRKNKQDQERPIRQRQAKYHEILAAAKPGCHEEKGIQLSKPVNNAFGYASFSHAAIESRFGKPLKPALLGGNNQAPHTKTHRCYQRELPHQQFFPSQESQKKRRADHKIDKSLKNT